MHKSINGAYMVPKGQTRLGATLKEKKKKKDPCLTWSLSKIEPAAPSHQRSYGSNLTKWSKTNMQRSISKLYFFSLHKTPKPS